MGDGRQTSPSTRKPTAASKSALISIGSILVSRRHRCLPAPEVFEILFGQKSKRGGKVEADIGGYVGHAEIATGKIGLRCKCTVKIADGVRYAALDRKSTRRNTSHNCDTR